jgi:hypothetical protein
MNKYHNGKIYSIKSKETDDIYIGSTIKSLKTRLQNHKSDYKSYQNGKKHYLTSFEIVKYDDCYIELLQDYSCENNDELTKKEGEYIRNNKCVNRVIEGRTDKEYHMDNRDKRNKQSKKWREENKEYYKEYNIENREKIKERKKKYYQENKDKIREYKKQYYQEQKKKKKEL